jgi:hypothetical protein
MRILPIVALAFVASCSTPVIRGDPRVDRPDRVLEVSASYYMPPGSFIQYVVREVAGRAEAYAFDPLSPAERTRLASSPALARYIDRIDSLITHRSLSDTNRTLAPNQLELCGDGFSYGARLTIGFSVRTVGARSCGDRSPGSSGRRVVLQGILDSLAKLTRSK